MRPRLEGETTGTPERPAQHLAGPVLTFDLAAELAQLHREEAWRKGAHNAMTLAKEGNLRIVLVAMKDCASLPTHQTTAREHLAAEDNLPVAERPLRVYGRVGRPCPRPHSFPT